jgi:hypothetical protein
MQTISLQSTPDGADCILMRDGERLARAVTPASITISRSMKGVRVTCTKAGFEEGRTVIAAEREPAASLNVPISVFALGSAADLASGASSRYPSLIRVSLSPEGSTPQSPPSPATVVPLAAPTAAAQLSGRFDGSYSGNYVSRAVLSGSGPNVNYQIKLTVVGGQGTGTASSSACPFPGDVSVTIDADGKASGEIDLRRDSACQPDKRKTIGRIENGDLRLVLQPVGRVTLMRAQATAN